MCLCRWRLSARKRAARNPVRRELCLYIPACPLPSPNRLASEGTPGWAAQDQEPGACSHRGWLCEACRDRLPGHPRGPQELMVRTRAHGVASGPGPCSATLPASSVDEGKTANLSESQCPHVNGVGTPAPSSRARWVGGQDSHPVVGSQGSHSGQPAVSQVERIIGVAHIHHHPTALLTDWGRNLSLPRGEEFNLPACDLAHACTQVRSLRR